MWDLIVSVPDHCLSFYFTACQIWLSLPEVSVERKTERTAQQAWGNRNL